jgi:hypothetical protein
LKPLSTRLSGFSLGEKGFLGEQVFWRAGPALTRRREPLVWNYSNSKEANP